MTSTSAWVSGQNLQGLNPVPERTLIIYDEFANNLNSKTVGGGGTTDDREANIRKLLNFFPVIAEDNDGKMIELDVRQVVTIPKAIKAQEVVKRGFMSNLLFRNISGIFASTEAREILEQLNPVAQGKIVPSQTGYFDISFLWLGSLGRCKRLANGAAFFSGIYM